MKLCASFFLASVVLLSSKVVFADSVYIDMVRVGDTHAGRPLGSIWAVDSWFLTLVTLNFGLSNVPSGSYQVRLHEVPDCERPGDVYNPYGDIPGQRIGDLLSDMVVENGILTGIHGIKPPTLTSEAHKLTVIEMRGHALLLHFVGVGDVGDVDDVVACGVVREGEWEHPR